MLDIPPRSWYNDKKREGEIMPRLTFEIDEDVKRLFKAKIAFRGISVKAVLSEFCRQYANESEGQCVTCLNNSASRDTYPYCVLCDARHQLEHANGEIERLQAELARVKGKATSRGGNVPR